MKHIDFDIELNIYEDAETLEALYQICERKNITRTFSNWRQLTSVWDIMQMLGYTVHNAERTDSRFRYQIASWFGNDSDEKTAYQIACSL